MTRIIGRLTNIGIGVEGTSGTPVAADFWVPVTGMDFDDKVNYIDNDSGLGRIEELNESDINQLWAEGNYEGKIFAESVGAELVALFGTSPTSEQRTTTGVYDHTWALGNNNQHKSLTLCYKNANQDLRYAYAMLNTWAMEAALDNYVRRTATWISKKSASATNSPSISEEIEFIPDDISFFLEDALDDLDGGTPVAVRNFQMEINKNAEAQYVLGSNEPDSINNKQFAVTGSFEAYFDDTTHRDRVFANTKQAMRIDMTGSQTIGSSGSHKSALRFDFAKVKFGEFGRSYDSNEIMLQTVNFTALFSITDSEMIAARLTNEQDGTIYA